MRHVAAILLLVGVSALPVQAAENPIEKSIYELVLQTVMEVDSKKVQGHFCSVAPGLWQKAVEAGVYEKAPMRAFVNLANELGCPLPKTRAL